MNYYNASEFVPTLKKLGLNVYFVATADKDGNIEKAEVNGANPCCQCYSVSKTFTALAAGICFDKGVLSPDSKVTEVLKKYLPEKYDQKWNDVTLHDLLRHRSGLTSGILDIDCLNASEFGTFDYLKRVLSQSIEGKTGEHFCYTDDVFYLASRMVAEASGIEASKLLRHPLMKKMGFRQYAWSVCPEGYAMGGTGLFLCTEDMVKLGVLFLRGGDWFGERIVSEKWVDLCFENGYGLDFTNEDGWAFKGGMRGQGLAVNREKNAVVAWHGFGKYAWHEVLFAPRGGQNE